MNDGGDGDTAAAADDDGTLVGLNSVDVDGSSYPKP